MSVMVLLVVDCVGCLLLLFCGLWLLVVVCDERGIEGFLFSARFRLSCVNLDVDFLSRLSCIHGVCEYLVLYYCRWR